LVLSAAKEIESGARAMLLLADGLFRLDVVVSGDTLRTVVRNLSNGVLEIKDRTAGPVDASIAYGEAAAYQPGSTGLDFSLDQGAERVSVKVTIGTLRFAERGTIRVSAQALVRQAPGE
jgi:hypothetical protein